MIGTPISVSDAQCERAPRGDTRCALRILHIVPLLGQGGAERVLSNLVVGSQGKAEHEVVTILDAPAFFELPGAPVSTLASTASLAGLPRTLLALRARIGRARPHVVQSWLYYGNLYAAAAIGLGTPVVWSVHNTTLSKKNSRIAIRLAARLGAPLSYIVPARIHYCSEGARAFHEAAGYDPSRTVVIENGIAVEDFRFDPLQRAHKRERLGITPTETVFGMVARLNPQKNHALVIEAVARIAAEQNSRLLLIGAGCTPNNPALASLLARHDLTHRAICLGLQIDVPALMSAIDVLVIGSSFGEALPLVAIEAAAAGLPVVATAVGDVAPFVLDPAHLVPSDDAVRLAAALSDAARCAMALDRTRPEDDPRRATLKQYTTEHMVERFLALYNELASPDRLSVSTS